MALELQSFTVDIPTEDLGTEILYEGLIDKVEVKKYEMLAGKRYWEDKKYVYKPEQKKQQIKVKIVSHKLKVHYGFPKLPYQIEDNWEVYMNDERVFTDIEVTRYRILQTKIAFEGCTRCG